MLSINASIGKYYIFLFFMFSFVIVSEWANTRIIAIKDIFIILVIIKSITQIKVIKNNENKALALLLVLVILSSALNAFPSGFHGFIRLIFTVSLFLIPLWVSMINVSVEQIKASAWLLFFSGFIILVFWSELGFLQNWNNNSIGYLSYMGISAGVMVYLFQKKYLSRTFIFFLLLVSAILIMRTEARNVAFSYFIVIVMIVFNKVTRSKFVYRLFYGFAMSYCIILPRISSIVDQNRWIYDKISTLSYHYFNKQGIFSGRLYIWERGFELISESPISYVFGHGKLLTTLGAHNNYIPIVYSYGLVGAILIATYFIIIFERAGKASRNGDQISYGCAVILIGVFLQLGAEGYLFAIDMVTLMPFVYIGIILRLTQRTKDYVSIQRRDCV